MLSLSAFDAFAGSVGDPKPFVITDTNKDGTVGGGDFGISIEGGSLVFKNDAVPFVSAKSSTLADHIYSTHKNKKIIMIGERHQTNASDITVDLLKLAKADGKKTNAFIELSELDFGDAIKDLNATSPESLLKDDVRNKIYDKMVSSYCASLNKLSGKEGFFNSSKLNELAKTDVSTKMRLEQFENIILMRYFGASIKLVDPYSIYAISSNGKNINYNTREDGIYKLVSGSVADDCLNICVVGAGHASKFKTEVLHGGVEKPLGMQLDAAYGAKNVAHISIFPDLAKISKRDPGQLAAYSELAPPTSPTAKQSPAGKSKPADYDMFLYHDWRE